MSSERTSTPMSGYTAFALVLLLLLGGAAGIIAMRSPVFLWAIVIALLMLPGFFFLNPNFSCVLVLFGDYKGTVRKNGFYWVNPLFVKKRMSLRARNFDSEKIKVNDKVGNPIQIGVILVWQVNDTFKASFDVDNYEGFVRIQSDSAV